MLWPETHLLHNCASFYSSLATLEKIPVQLGARVSTKPNFTSE